MKDGFWFFLKWIKNTIPRPFRFKIILGTMGWLDNTFGYFKMNNEGVSP